MFRLKATVTEPSTVVRLAVPKSMHAQLAAAASTANIDIQEAMRQAIAYALSKAGKGDSTSITSRRVQPPNTTLNAPDTLSRA